MLLDSGATKSFMSKQYCNVISIKCNNTDIV